MTDKRFVVLVLGPIVIASICFTAAASMAKPDTFALRFGALAGAACYASAWLIVSVFRSIAVRGSERCRDQAVIWSGVKDLASWTIAGSIAGLALTIGMRAGAGFEGAHRAERLAVLGITWTIISVWGGELVYIGLRSYAKRGDMDREWLARAAGWQGAAAATWSVFSAMALLGPHLLDLGGRSLAAFLAAASVTGATSVLLGSSARTAANLAAVAGRRLSLNEIAGIAGVLFAVFLGVGLSLLDNLLTALAVSRLPWLHDRPFLGDAVGLVLLICFSLVLSFFVNVNRFSLHAVYRNRLVRAFLGSARAAAQSDRVPDPFTKFDPSDDPPMGRLRKERPLHVINATLNVVSTDRLAWQERKAEPFTISPLACGNPSVGYRPTRRFGSRDEGVTLGTAMAISGAAVSPNMGYHSSPILGFLLMLFNARLGWWLGNPRGPHFEREGPIFSLAPLLQELAGQTTDQGSWIYLSDGGHFDNLGLYEMVRRRCRTIVVSDAGCDPDCTLGDLGDAIRKIYIDLGISIEFKSFDIAPRKNPPERGVYGAIGRIVYPGSAEPGWLLYLKPGYHGGEPTHVRSYAEVHKAFPHEPTSQQWFSESQFEAYRALGAHMMEQICDGGRPLDSLRHPSRLDLAQFRERAERAVLSPQAEGRFPLAARARSRHHRRYQ